jgi:ActR/RegA family two-component response regulator
VDTILILDPDHEHAAALGRALIALSCRTILCRGRQEALDILRRRVVDVVVLVAKVTDEWKTCMEALSAAARQCVNPPGMACILRGPYGGPSEKLYGARRGIRVIYERY